jgi:hypothetical protein
LETGLKRLLVLFAVFISGSGLWAQPVPSGLEFEIVDGKSVTITRYRGNATALTIPGRIQGLPVTAIGDRTFRYCRNLVSITIPSSVTSIGNRAFKESSSLTGVTIPSSVTVIGEQAFMYCSGLENITIPSSVTSIGEMAFYYCTKLISITVDRLNPDYASVDGVLFDKNMRTIITYPAGKNAESYTIPTSVTDIGIGAFGGSGGLTSIAIPSSVTDIKDGAFWSCYSLTSIVIPSSVRSIGHAAFGSCYDLASITIPSSVTSIASNTFTECVSLPNIIVDSDNPAYASVDGVLFDKTLQTIITYPAGKNAKTYDIPSSVRYIGEWAFSACGTLTSITIPSSVTVIGDFAFYACNNLTSVTLSRHTQFGENTFPDLVRITYRD